MFARHFFVLFLFASAQILRDLKLVVCLSDEKGERAESVGRIRVQEGAHLRMEKSKSSEERNLKERETGDTCE